MYRLLRQPAYIGYRYDGYFNRWTRGKWEPIAAVEDYARINGRSPPEDAEHPGQAETRRKAYGTP